MEKEFYIYISSENSKVDFPFNTSDDFQIQLPEYLTLDANWVCCLKEINLLFVTAESTIDELLVMSDICGVSFFNSFKLPILRRLHLKSDGKKQKRLNSIFLEPFYLPVKQNRINILRVYIRKNNNQRFSYTRGEVNLTLHFKYIGN